jgi:hypothetical protein
VGGLGVFQYSGTVEPSAVLRGWKQSTIPGKPTHAAKLETFNISKKKFNTGRYIVRA